MKYHLSIAVDRSTKQALILFADAGGVEIEKVAKENPDAVRKASLPLIMHDVPQFMYGTSSVQPRKNWDRSLTSCTMYSRRKMHSLADITHSSPRLTG